MEESIPVVPPPLPLPPMRFLGPWDQLQGLVAQLGLDGHWRELGPCRIHRFRCGVSLNWWPASGEIRLVGPPALCRALQPRLELLLQPPTGRSPSRRTLTPRVQTHRLGRALAFA